MIQECLYLFGWAFQGHILSPKLEVKSGVRDSNILGSLLTDESICRVITK